MYCTYMFVPGCINPCGGLGMNCNWVLILCIVPDGDDVNAIEKGCFCTDNDVTGQTQYCICCRPQKAAAP